jgi:hypothetical protein
LLKELTRALVERAMHAELTHHLGYEKHAPDGKASGNSRNGTSAKTLKGDFGEVEIEVPRDRHQARKREAMRVIGFARIESGTIRQPSSLIHFASFCNT